MGMIDGIIGIAISVIILSGVLMTTLKTTNTSTWSASEVTLFGVIGIGAIIGLVVSTLRVFGVL